MVEQVVRWIGRSGGTHKSQTEAELADARSDIIFLISDDAQNRDLSRNSQLEPFIVTDFLVNNWVEIVPLMTAYINLTEKQRIENEDSD